MSLVVAKIGSSSLTDERGVIQRAAIAKLCAEVAGLVALGHRVCIVTSGAVAAGVAALHLATRPTDLPTLQALSAAGQSRLMEVYGTELDRHGLVAAQVLLVPHDFIDRRQYLHARQTLNRLLELGCVPVINENDAIADDEIRYGDNDRLAALVAQSIGADVLVLLTDTPGLFTADPRVDPSARLIEVVDDFDSLEVSVGGTGTNRGSGGMSSKLTAARMASWAGVRAVIAPAAQADVLAAAVAPEPSVGTTFPPHERRMGARKLWIAFAVKPVGQVVVDQGARRALVERGRSLLPAGVLRATGHFADGDAIELADESGHVFARGLVRADHVELAQMIGRRTEDLPDGSPTIVVHRDDLVVLAPS